MQIYLPIADLPVNIFVILAMGLAVGFISGMFGIGGGFLMTPLLIFLGISPAVAVASVTGHVAASSCSGAISYWRRRAIDVALAFMLLAGGILGTAFGVWLFTFLRAIGQLDITIGISYVLLLTAVGALMVFESLNAIIRTRQGKPVELRRPGSHTWFHGLPFKIRFKRSGIYVSAIPVWAIGFTIGFIGAVMGIGGGFLLVPMLIYFLRVPTATVSVVDFVATLRESASREAVNTAFKQAAAGRLKGILAYTEEPLVSSDFRGDAHSAIIDGLSTMALGGHFVKVVAWYDNEWGYACRMADLTHFISEALV